MSDEKLNEIVEDINNYFPACPVTVAESGRAITYYGMSLRDYFAGQALVGLLTQDDPRQDPELVPSDVNATLAYALADAMLEARKTPAE